MRKRTITVNGHRLEVGCRRHRYVQERGRLVFFVYSDDSGEHSSYFQLRVAANEYINSVLKKVRRKQDAAMWQGEQYTATTCTVGNQGGYVVFSAVQDPSSWSVIQQ